MQFALKGKAHVTFDLLGGSVIGLENAEKPIILKLTCLVCSDSSIFKDLEFVGSSLDMWDSKLTIQGLFPLWASLIMEPEQCSSATGHL